MWWEKGVHECLEVRPPPLRKCITNLPLIVDAFAGKLISYRCQTFVEAKLEPFDLIVFALEVVAWSFVSQRDFRDCKYELSYVQFEERIRYLQHQDMGMIVFVADEDPFACSSHAMLVVVLF